VALGVSALATGICVVINYLMPGKAFGFLMGLVVSALIINWALISWITCASARQAVRQTAASSAAPATLHQLPVPGLPAGILVVMFLTPDLQLSVYLIPVWLAALALGYRLRGKPVAEHAA
jgi:aromatic amino acid transport protein AroP